MILYTLDNEKSVREFYFHRRIKPYSILTIICALFSYVYSLFSHGVTSPFMTYLFIYPLCLGIIMGLLCMLFKKKNTNLFFATHFYHTGVVAVLLSSMLRGIFEIAGTASIYQTILMGIGLIMILGGFFCFILKK